jgi:hypothetical protein
MLDIGSEVLLEKYQCEKFQMRNNDPKCLDGLNVIFANFVMQPKW